MASAGSGCTNSANRLSSIGTKSPDSRSSIGISARRVSSVRRLPISSSVRRQRSIGIFIRRLPVTVKDPSEFDMRGHRNPTGARAIRRDAEGVRLGIEIARDGPGRGCRPTRDRRRSGKRLRSDPRGRYLSATTEDAACAARAMAVPSLTMVPSTITQTLPVNA